MSKRILILTFEFPPYRAGIGRYTAQLALGAHKLGCDVTVVAPDFKQQQREDEEDQFPFEVRRFKGTVYTTRQFPALVQRIRKLVSKESYDIIHAVDWPNCLALTLLNRFKDIPFIATVYGTEVLGVAGSRQVRYLSGGKLFVAPSRLLAISQFTKTLLLSRHSEVDAAKVQVTPLGVDDSFFDPPGGPNGIRTKFNIPPEKKILLTVSRLDERKGHRVVLQSLASLPADIRSSVAYVATGEAQNPGYLEELRQLASKVDVPVVFTGMVSENELRSLYANAYLFCMPGEPNPGKVEGFGLVYLEAAAQGLPSVASSIGAIPEVVVHDQTGVLVEPMNVPAYSEALTDLLIHPDRTRQLGQKAKERAATFTWENCVRLSYEL